MQKRHQVIRLVAFSLICGAAGAPMIFRRLSGGAGLQRSKKDGAPNRILIRRMVKIGDKGWGVKGDL